MWPRVAIRPFGNPHHNEQGEAPIREERQRKNSEGRIYG